MYHFLFLFSLFIIYSFIGWTIEMVVCAIADKKIVNRGFLVGPYCPIYGFSSLIMIGVLQKYLNDAFVLFIMAIFICTFTEYITSYIMEKIFHARWWDYTNIPFNLNGRVCLDTMIPFGLLGVTVVYVLNPIVMKGIMAVPFIVRKIVSIFLALVFICDLIVSSKVMSEMKHVKYKNKDNTEEITKKVKKALNEKNFFTKRLVDAFPDFTLLFTKTKDVFMKTKNEIKQKQKEIKYIKKKLHKEEKKLKKLNKK